jgi:DDE superfamily endonuclease
VQATFLWSLWQDLLRPFRDAFTTRGFFRFVEWLTGLVLNAEEHTVTQSLFGLDRPHDWKRLHNFVEYGHWNTEVIDDTLAELLETAPGRLWYGYRVAAVDDSKVHRSSKQVWGTCTFHEYTARCPNRATTVRAPNWVVLGALLPNPGQPAWFLPQTGRLYFRRSQLPDDLRPEDFRTKCQLAVALGQQQAQAVLGKHLAVCDGAFAVRSVVRPLVRPEEGQPRVDILTRLRHDACLFDRPPERRPAGRRGPKPKWGRRLPPPRQAGRWPEPWQEGEAFLYGRRRRVRSKEKVCLWRVLGWQTPAKVVVAEVEGYTKRFFLVSTAVDLSGLQMLELFGARFRQEDGFRDLKQRLGWEECRAWTKKPVQRTAWAQMLAMSVLRLLQLRLEGLGEKDWWYRPPGNKKKVRPSILDLERLWRSHRTEILRCLSAWLGSEGETACAETAEVMRE